MLTAVLPPALPSAGLTEGLPVETVAVVLVFKMLMVVLGVTLLLAGRRLPRLNFGLFFLLLGAALSWPALSGRSYGLVVLSGLAASIAGVALFSLLPRCVTAACAIWPLPGLYLTFVWMRGDFDVGWWLPLSLALGGLAAAAWLPKLGQVLLASAQGVALIAVGIPWARSTWVIFGLFGTGAAVQVLSSARSSARRRGFKPNTLLFPLGKAKWLGQYALWAPATIASIALLFCLLVPSPRLGASPVAERVASLRERGALRRPGLLLSAEDSFYLCGRALPISLVSERGGLLSRLTLPFLGANPAKKIHAMRAVKDRGELALMRTAAEITSRAFTDVAPLIRPGVNESELEKAILDSFRKNGATGVAFRSVVGSGPNATLPHYQENDAELSKGFVVLDIGCIYNHYASDMTRTFPVTGRYDGAQWLIIQTLAAALERAKSAIRPGATMREVDARAREVISEAGFGPYFTHSAGHHLGLDVHDPHAERLSAGMVITVEPGIYIPKGAAVGREYWDLGARVENSYIVTDDGWEEITHFPLVPAPSAAVQ